MSIYTFKKMDYNFHMKYKTSFGQFLDKEYLKWQQELQRRATQGEFAEYIGVERSLLSHYLNNGTLPTKEMAQRIAERLGPEVFRVLENADPDPVISWIGRNWQNIPPEIQEQLIGLIKAYTQEPIPQDKKNTAKQNV